MRVREIHALEVFGLTYAVATLTRYVLCRELLQDIRGLRRSPATDQEDAPPAARRAA
jgi:hypothetical protein